MILIPVSFNGTVINATSSSDYTASTDYDAYFRRDANTQLQLSSQVGYVKRAGAVPVMAGKDFQPATLILNVHLLHDHMSLFESLNQLFDVQDETPRQLIVQDTDMAQPYTQYYIYATPKQVQTEASGGPEAIVTLAVDDPIWQSVTQNSQSFATTSSTDSTSVTAAGNADSYPIFEITPGTAPSTDYLYHTYLQILPTSTDPWSGRPLNLTGSTDTTLDTAALVAAGKMQADGDDLRVFRDGVEVDRWLSGINTTDTKVWVVTDLPGAHTMSLKTALGAGAETEIVLNYTTANKAEISALPNSGRLIVDASLGSTDTEEFTYTAKTITATKLSFTLNARNVRETTAIAHAANQNVRFLPYDFTIIYGNATVSAPVTDDTRKPIIDLTSSNASFVYSAFYDDARLRSGIFTPMAAKVSSPTLTRSGIFTSTNDAADVTPATEMGLKALTYESLGIWRSDSIILGWLGFFPDGIASLGPVSGDQTQSTVSWPTMAMKASPNNLTYTQLWAVAAQTSSDYGTWTAWSKATTDYTAIPTNSKYLQFLQSGTVAGTTDIYAKGGVSALTIGLTNYPHVMIRTEGSNAQINITITNSTTGESMTVNYPMIVNDTLIIDTDPDFPNAKYKGQLVNGAISLSSIRAAWLKLQPGANTLFYDNNLAAPFDITIVVKWRDRQNFL